MRLKDVPVNVTICGLAKIEGEWKVIMGITKQIADSITLVIDNKTYNDPNIEIEI